MNASTPYVYDGLGNIISVGNMMTCVPPVTPAPDTFTYDALCRLTGAFVHQSTYGHTYSYGYDGFGNLTSRSEAVPGGYADLKAYILATGAVQAAADAYISALAFSAQVGTDPVLGPTNRLSTVTRGGGGTGESLQTFPQVYDNSGTTLTPLGEKVYIGAGALTAMMRQTVSGVTTTSYYGTDHLGTVRATVTVNTSGTETARSLHDYEPFGVEIVPLQASLNTHRYTGHERDVLNASSNATMDYMHARYYGSNLGRFMRPDNGVDQNPMNPQSWNLYAYVNNNPVNLNDPTGHYAGGAGDSNIFSAANSTGAEWDGGQDAGIALMFSHEYDGTVMGDSAGRLPALFKDLGIDPPKSTSTSGAPITAMGKDYSFKFDPSFELKHIPKEVAAQCTAVAHLGQYSQLKTERTNRVVIPSFGKGPSAGFFPVFTYALTGIELLFRDPNGHLQRGSQEGWFPPTNDSPFIFRGSWPPLGKNPYKLFPALGPEPPLGGPIPQSTIYIGPWYGGIPQ